MLSWLETARNRAEQRFRSLPGPTGKEEGFQFSKGFFPMEFFPGEEKKTEGKFPLPEEEELAVLNLRGDHADCQGAIQGFLFTDLMRAALLGSDLVKKNILDHEVFAQDKYAQLCAARWKNGSFLHIPAGVKLEKNLRINFSPASLEEHSRNLFLLEEGAAAVLIQEVSSEEGTRFVGELTELRMGPGAKLHWVFFQRYGAGTRAMIRHKIELAEGASLRITHLSLGASASQVRMESELQQDSSLTFLGGARGNMDQQFDFWLDTHHRGQRSKSDTQFYFVMGDRSRSVFNGLINIPKEVVDCEAVQKSKSLLLGSKSTVHAIPKLIIQTDAVKCGHGASISSVNSEQLHYLQSRGIHKNEAEKMIVRGFTQLVLESLPSSSLYERAESHMEMKEGEVLQ